MAEASEVYDEDVRPLVEMPGLLPLVLKVVHGNNQPKCSSVQSVGYKQLRGILLMLCAMVCDKPNTPVEAKCRLSGARSRAVPMRRC